MPVHPVMTSGNNLAMDCVAETQHLIASQKRRITRKLFYINQLRNPDRQRVIHGMVAAKRLEQILINRSRFCRNDEPVTRLLCTSLLVLAALWMGTSLALPTPNYGAAPQNMVIWRKTDSGWVRAEAWLDRPEGLLSEPRPPIYPVTVLPTVLAVSVIAILIWQPKQ
ncbi:hypothetical protein GC197_11540 [bacterium]|nr:hypothetical protein [bacterium]